MHNSSTVNSLISNRVLQASGYANQGRRSYISIKIIKFKLKHKFYFKYINYVHFTDFPVYILWSEFYTCCICNTNFHFCSQNSIRHNLSLHNRFMRIQNEGDGRSSWWILNHDAKSEKTKRKNRSSSLDSDAAGGPKIKTNKRDRKATKHDNVDERPQNPSSKYRVSIASKFPITGGPSVIHEDSPFPFPFPIADYQHH